MRLYPTARHTAGAQPEALHQRTPARQQATLRSPTSAVSPTSPTVSASPRPPGPLISNLRRRGHATWVSYESDERAQSESPSQSHLPGPLTGGASGRSGNAQRLSIETPSAPPLLSMSPARVLFRHTTDLLQELQEPRVPAGTAPWRYQPQWQPLIAAQQQQQQRQQQQLYPALSRQGMTGTGSPPHRLTPSRSAWLHMPGPQPAMPATSSQNLSPVLHLENGSSPPPP